MEHVNGDSNELYNQLKAHLDEKFNAFAEETRNKMSTLSEEVRQLDEKFSAALAESKKGISLFGSGNKKLYENEIQQIKSKIIKAGKILEMHAGTFISRDELREILEKSKPQQDGISLKQEEHEKRIKELEQTTGIIDENNSRVSERLASQAKTFEDFINTFSEKIKEIRRELLLQLDAFIKKEDLDELKDNTNKTLTEIESVMSDLAGSHEQIEEKINDLKEKTGLLEGKFEHAITDKKLKERMASFYEGINSCENLINEQGKKLEKLKSGIETHNENQNKLENDLKNIEKSLSDTQLEHSKYLKKLISDLEVKVKEHDEDFTNHKELVVHKSLLEEQIDAINKNLQNVRESLKKEFIAGKEELDDIRRQMEETGELKKYFTEKINMTVPKQNFDGAINLLTKNIRELQYSIKALDVESTQNFEKHLGNLATKTEDLKIELDAVVESSGKKDKSIENLKDDIRKIKETINKIITLLNTQQG